MTARQWAMFLHFSLLAGFIVPILGLIAPIIIWQLKKSDLPEIDAHGKMVVNWIISAVIYSVICFLLTYIFIGLPLLFVLAALCVIFPIIGGIKANDGVLWKYPLAIQFLK
jgi:uncharacterized Tic20 family protein